MFGGRAVAFRARAQAFALAVAAAALGGCAGQSDPPLAVGTQTFAPSECGGLSKDDVVLGNQGNTAVLVDTAFGCFVVELFHDQVALTAGNFRRYVDEGFYDGTIVHRIADGFVLQAGGYDASGAAKRTHKPIRNEAQSSGLENDNYTLSMARGAARDSATSQFFVNLGDNCFLDPKADSTCPDTAVSPDGFAVFGLVVAGRPVVDAIAHVPVGKSHLHPYCSRLEDRFGGSCPIEPVVIRLMRTL